MLPVHGPEVPKYVSPIDLGNSGNTYQLQVEPSLRLLTLPEKLELSRVLRPSLLSRLSVAMDILEGYYHTECVQNQIELRQ
jgi:hypothetical protein